MAFSTRPASRHLGTVRPWWSACLPIIAGALVATTVTVMLQQGSMVWTVLVIVALVGLLPTFVVKDPHLYWLAMFLSLSILEIKKNLLDGFQIQATFKLDYDMPILVPSVSLSDCAFVVLLGIWALRIRGRQDRLRISGAGWVALGYLGWATLSLLKAPILYFGVIALVREIKFFVVFLYVVNNIDSKRALRLIATVMLALLLLQASVTLARYQFRWGYLGGELLGRMTTDLARDPLLTVTSSESGEITGSRRRAFGTIGSPAGTAEYLLLLLPVAVFASFKVSTFPRRAGLLLLFALGTAALVVTFSRAALNGFFVGLVLTAWLTYRRRIFPPRALAFILIGLSVMAIWTSPLIYSFYNTRPTPITIRFAQYSTALDMILANPILGVGVNNSAGLQREYNPALSSVPLGDPTKYSYKAPIHNYFLSMTAETGLVGTTLFLTFFFLVIREALRWTHSPDPDVLLASGAVVVSIVSLLVGILADPFYQEPTQVLLWFMAGLAVAFRRIAEDSPVTERAAFPRLHRIGGTID